MKCICIINNFNYGEYLEEAIISALNQTIPFDEIIVIDDGSTDNSLEVLKKYERHDNVKVFFKENEGQMSCFNLIPKIVPKNARVFLLDSDDLYPKDYLESVMKLLSLKGFNYVASTFCDFRIFSDKNNILLTSLPNKEYEIVFYKYTSCIVRNLRVCLGTATSCLSFSGDFLHEILPYPYYQDWRIEADLVLLNVAAILNASRVYLKNLFVNYRLHEKNLVLGKKENNAKLLEKQLKIERLFNYYINKYQLFDKCIIKEILRDIGHIKQIGHINYFGASKIEKIYLKFLYILSRILLKNR